MTPNNNNNNNITATNDLKDSSKRCIANATATTRNLVVGRTRVRCPAGYRGTVAYVGPVASSKDPDTIYAGIVWDDPSRGKHNGSVVVVVESRRTTHPHSSLVSHGFRSTHATAASFVKLSRLDTGRALTVDLLRQKYVDLEDEERVAPNNLLPHTAQTSSGKNNKPIEFLGELKIRQRQQLHDLTGISLRLAGISSVATPKDPSWQQLRHVQELDLAGNLLWDWKHVWNLMGNQDAVGLPNLRKLSLASNRLSDWDNQNQQIIYPKLRHLNVNETNIQKISTILALGHVFPYLEELVLANNATNQPKFILDPPSPLANTTDCEPSPSICNKDDMEDQDCEILASQLAKVFANLKFLDCSNCTGLFTDLVQAWSQLPNLQSLSLDSNPDITSFSKRHCPSSESDGNQSNNNERLFYPSLQHLQLAGSSISYWNNVLAAWQSLTSLRLRSCPLAAQWSRTQILAHLPHLQQLNASTVSQPERREAARWCLWRQQQQQQQQQTNNDDDDVIPEKIVNYWKVEFPELAAAADGHHRQSPTSTTNLMDSSSSSFQQPNELAVINVTIRSMAADSCTREPLIRRLPTQLTVSKIKALCARQFGLDRDLQILHFCRSSTTSSSSAADGFPECLDCDSQTLAYYGVPDGAELLMNELDVAEQQRMAENEVERQLERVQAQERELYEFQERQKRANNM